MKKSKINADIIKKFNLELTRISVHDSVMMDCKVYRWPSFCNHANQLYVGEYDLERNRPCRKGILQLAYFSEKWILQFPVFKKKGTLKQIMKITIDFLENNEVAMVELYIKSCFKKELEITN